jgi:hypothetical protein
MAEDKEKYKDFLAEALGVYNIPTCFVLAWRYDLPTDSMVVVTHGGKKISHKRGAGPTVTLSEGDISGFLPKSELYWCEKLNQRISIDELIKK